MDYDSSERISTSKRCQKEKYVKTAILNLTFLCMALAECVKGPCLLELRDLLETTISTISYLFLVRSVGSIFGAFSGGFVLERLERLRYLILFTFLLFLGISNAIIPFSGSLPVFFSCVFVAGFCTAALDAGGNVLCLDIWRGLEVGPYMHSIHFSFSLGTFLAPLMAEHFLGSKIIECRNETQITKMDISDRTCDVNAQSDTKITILFTSIGTFAVLVSFGYLYFGCRDLLQDPQHHPNEECNIEDENESMNEQFVTAKKAFLVFVGLTLTFVLVYVGLEVTIITFLATFAVTSSLKLTKQMGARLTAMAGGGFCLLRFISIFASTRISSLVIVSTSLIVILMSSIFLVVFNGRLELNVELLAGLMFAIGAGCGPIFGANMLFVEKHISVTHRIGSAIIICASIGADLFPILLGQVIGYRPSSYLSFLLCLSAICCILFISIVFVARCFLATKNRTSVDFPLRNTAAAAEVLIGE